MAQSEHDRRVDYIELPATDVQRTRHFYERVFGWKFEDYGPGYTSFVDGRIAGGFSRERQVASGGGALVVLYAVDLEQIQQTIQQEGGRIVKQIFSFPGGRRFHFTDPSGNELAVWSE